VLHGYDQISSSMEMDRPLDGHSKQMESVSRGMDVGGDAVTSIPCKKRPVMGKKWQGTKVLTLPQKMGNGNATNMKGGT
jgi:hypothetical protein